MKKYLLAVKATFSLLLLSSGLAVAQPTTPNLVTNGDFEQRNSPPHGPGRSGGQSNIGPLLPQIATSDDLPYWFRTNTINSQTSVPGYIASDGQPGSNTSSLGITAHNSVSCIYIGRHDSPGDKSHDDFLTQELNQTLSEGHLYHVEFWALRMGSSVFHTKLAISITSGVPTYDGAQNSLIPSPGSKVLVSPDIQQYYAWVKVAGDIVIPANDRGNKWLTIGNDRSDQTIDYNLPDNGQNGILFAIDDVSLVDMGCANPIADAYQDFSEGNCTNVASFIISNYDPSSTYTFTKVYGNPVIIYGGSGNQFRVKVGGLQAPYGATFTMTATSSCGASSVSDVLSATYPCEPATPTYRTVNATEAYPNPANESLIAPNGVESATLVNSAGKPVRVADQSGKLDVQSLPEGLYNLRIMRDGKLINQRIQVKH
jgi:hypothetical protein